MEDNFPSSKLDILSDFLPENQKDLIHQIGNLTQLGPAINHLLNACVESFYKSSSYKQCLEYCSILLDILWEKLNTGHWKNVALEWRVCYSIISLMKACSQLSLVLTMENTQSGVSIIDAIKSCDMGLLMGAPLKDNNLSKLASYLHQLFKSLDENLTPVEIKRQKKDIQAEKTDFSIVSPSGKGHFSKAENLSNDSLSTKETLKNPFLDSIHKTGENSKLLNIERLRCPSIESFCKEFYQKEHPLIILDAISFWPAMKKWNLDYMKRIAGNRLVPIEIGSKYTDDSWTQKLMTISEFIENYIIPAENQKLDCVGYLAQHQLFEQIEELKNDVTIPTYCCLGQDEDVCVNAWFGPKGTVSPLHYDPKHNFLCQVLGRKTIRLYSPSLSNALYPHEGHLLNNTSQVDVEKPDFEKFPLFQELPFMEFVLEPGEMLYIPPKYWHFVKSLSLSFSVSFWWE